MRQPAGKGDHAIRCRWWASDGLQRAPQRLGEVCFAFVEPAEGVPCTPETVIEACRGQIADYEVPRRMVVMREFPRTTTNKIQRNVLQQRAVDLTNGGQ